MTSSSRIVGQFGFDESGSALMSVKILYGQLLGEGIQVGSNTRLGENCPEVDRATLILSAACVYVRAVYNTRIID